MPEGSFAKNKFIVASWQRSFRSGLAGTFLEPSFPLRCHRSAISPSTRGDSLPAVFSAVSFRGNFPDHIREKLKLVNGEFLDNLVQTILLTSTMWSHKNAFFRWELSDLFDYGQPLYVYSNAHICVCTYIFTLQNWHSSKGQITCVHDTLGGVRCQWVLELIHG